tara:strand:- start:1774 stop:2115 length:342 start_codon:yes stop_codon:yes gene_type:complete
MDESLVFRLVYDTCIKNNYKKNTIYLANKLDYIISKIRIAEKETHLRGIMEIISYISELILKEYGYSTRWFLKKPPCYYPLKIQALNLFVTENYEPLDSNPLGGYNVYSTFLY